MGSVSQFPVLCQIFLVINSTSDKMSQSIRTTPTFAGTVLRSTKANKVAAVSASTSPFLSNNVRVTPSTTCATGRTVLSVTARDAAWAPGSEAPAHLDGSLPGDFGFDP